MERQTDVVFFLLFNKISQVEMDLLEMIPLSDRDWCVWLRLVNKMKAAV